MKCNNCGREMTLGYIQCRDGVYWNANKKRIAAIAGGGKGSILLSGLSEGPFAGSSAEAYKCDNCKIVMIKYK